MPGTVPHDGTFLPVMGGQVVDFGGTYWSASPG